jgi:hypothetical protein
LLAGAARPPAESVARRSDRNTILYRRGTGGAPLRCVGANAPRNLRAIAAQVVLIDEADALQDRGRRDRARRGAVADLPAPVDDHRRHPALERHKPRGALVCRE